MHLIFCSCIPFIIVMWRCVRIKLGTASLYNIFDIGSSPWPAEDKMSRVHIMFIRTGRMQIKDAVIWHYCECTRVYPEGRSLRRSCSIGSLEGVQKHYTYIYDWKSRGWILTGWWEARGVVAVCVRLRYGCAGGCRNCMSAYMESLGAGGRWVGNHLYIHFVFFFYLLPHASKCRYRFCT